MKTVDAVMPGKESTLPDPAVLQADLLRYADDYFGRTSAGLDEYARRSNTAEARNQALDWELAIDSSVLGIATGPNPMANLVDFLALASITRTFLEQRAGEAKPPGAFGPWLENSRVLESNAWKLAEGILTPKQQAEFRALINEWLKANSGEGNHFFKRPQELASGIRQTAEQQKQPGSLFSMVGLDPMANLDPAVREITRTRLFAERALFAAERMPWLIRWQTQALTQQILREQQLSNALASADRFSRAAESVSQTAALLPDRLSAERKAILDAFQAQEGPLRDLSADATRTLTAGSQMSTSLNTTIISFDALMKRFGVGEPSASPPKTNAPPFNILDYARTAEQIGTAAQQLDVLIKDASGTMDAPALDQRMAQLSGLSNQARADAKSVLNHAFLLLAGLIVLSFVCALLYRRLAAAGLGTQRRDRPAGEN